MSASEARLNPPPLDSSQEGARCNCSVTDGASIREERNRQGTRTAHAICPVHRNVAAAIRRSLGPLEEVPLPLGVPVKPVLLSRTPVASPIILMTTVHWKPRGVAKSGDHERCRLPVRPHGPAVVSGWEIRNSAGKPVCRQRGKCGRGRRGAIAWRSEPSRAVGKLEFPEGATCGPCASRSTSFWRCFALRCSRPNAAHLHGGGYRTSPGTLSSSA